MNNRSQYAPTEEELAFASASVPASIEKIQRTTSKYAPTQEELSFAAESENFPEEGRSELSNFRSYLQAGARGFIKGVTRLGQAFGPLLQTPANRQADIEEFEQGVEELLPTKEGVAERYIERGATAIPSTLAAIATGAPTLLTAAGAGTGAILGQTAEEVGLQEPIPTIAEIVPGAFAGLFGGKIPPATAKEKELLHLGRNFGISEKDLAVALKEPKGVRKWLAKFGWKGESIQERIKQSKEALGNIYEGLKQSPEAFKKIDPKHLPGFSDDLRIILKDLNPTIRNQIKQPLKELMHSKGRGEDFIRFYQHVNAEVKDPMKIGKLQALTRETLNKIDPILGKDFELANDLYTNVNRVGHALRGPAIDMLLVTKAGGALYGLYTGDYRLMAASMGSIAARRLATDFLLNPKLQNLHAKFVTAMNQGRNYLAIRTLEKFREEVKDVSPEFYEQTKGINPEDLVRAKPSKNEKE